ncbi:type II toxin-antitoxin system RelE/ParE family toxin [Lysinibacter cavernae]|uniref:type II toxin-antitoxin system RelE/ParE family toxin n=1 Tax=Lysinibacter cavernae TaxID=1640652 RepID=UPI001FB914F2|nr:type II toxin-antitoxin system RelE/ParE family toxin [Lysinibacter cavernae]
MDTADADVTRLSFRTCSCVLPSDRLNALNGDRTEPHSIRINDQWRICFRWEDTAAGDVSIVDYR